MRNTDYIDDNMDWGAIEEDIIPEFHINKDILKELAYIKRSLVSLALNAENGDDQEIMIKLQDIVDSIVFDYVIGCVDDFVMG